MNRVVRARQRGFALPSGDRRWPGPLAVALGAAACALVVIAAAGEPLRRADRRVGPARPLPVAARHPRRRRRGHRPGRHDQRPAGRWRPDRPPAGAVAHDRSASSPWPSSSATSARRPASRSRPPASWRSARPRPPSPATARAGRPGWPSPPEGRSPSPRSRPAGPAGRSAPAGPAAPDADGALPRRRGLPGRPPPARRRQGRGHRRLPPPARRPRRRRRRPAATPRRPFEHVTRALSTLGVRPEPLARA